jgi:hypothetical protein
VPPECTEGLSEDVEDKAHESIIGGRRSWLSLCGYGLRLKIVGRKPETTHRRIE